MMVLDICVPLLPLNPKAETLVPPRVMGWEAGPLTEDQIRSVKPAQMQLVV